MTPEQRAQAVARRGERRIAERRKCKEQRYDHPNGRSFYRIGTDPIYIEDVRHIDRRSASPAAVQADAITRLEQAAKEIVEENERLHAELTVFAERNAVMKVRIAERDAEIARLRQVIAEHREALEPCGGCEECEETGRTKP